MSENNRRTNSRLNRPSRKKKANTILNILIGIVLLLIVVVVVNIVTGDDTEKAKENEPAVSEESAGEDESAEESSENETDTDTDVADIESIKPEANEESQNDTDDSEQTDEEATEDTFERTEVITETSDDPNVDSVIIDPSWSPIGTSQTGDHASSYDTKSVDWAEKVQALAYAAGLDESNMYVKFIGNGGSPQKSIGTVTSKDGSEIYRINLEWVDGEGWKPTKKEVLKAVKDAS